MQPKNTQKKISLQHHKDHGICYCTKGELHPDSLDEVGKRWKISIHGKIERYHKTLYQERIYLKEFRSLSHFKRDSGTSTGNTTTGASRRSWTG